ncbi:hypothetical protein SEA_HARVEYSR_66 [Mycobacterium phage HarveySr]
MFNTMDGQRTETLDQFSAMLDDFAGRAVGFADAVRELRRFRMAKNVQQARRKAINEALDRHYARGNVVTGSGLILRRTRPAPATKRAVTDTNLVKRLYPEIYAACRVPTSFVQVKAVDGAVQPYAFHLPDVPESHESLDRVKAALDAAILPDEVKRGGEAARDRLIEIGDEFGWNGLPLSFADAWSVGLRRLAFDDAVLRSNHPDVAAACEHVVERSGSSKLYFAKPTDGETDGYAE